MYAMLNETIGLVKKEIAEGKTLSEIKAAGLPDKYKDYGGGFVNAGRWIEAIYRDASKK